MLDDLKDSEAKLSALLNNMDRTESRIDDLLADLESNQVRYDKKNFWCITILNRDFFLAVL